MNLLLLTLSFILPKAHAGYDFSSCKTYRVSGWVSCAENAKEADCQWVISKGTRSETHARIFSKLNSNTLAMRKLNTKFVTAEVRVRDITNPTLEILSRPSNVLEAMNPEAVKCVTR